MSDRRNGQRGPYKPVGRARPLTPVKESKAARHIGWWLARVVDVDGARRQVGRERTKSAAAARARAAAEEWNEYADDEPQMTLLEWNARWPERRALSERTVYDNAQRMNKYVLPHMPRGGDIPLTAINRAMVRDVQIALLRAGLAKATIDGALSTLSAVLGYALDEDLIDVNPAHRMRVNPDDARLQPKRPARPRRAVSADELAAFIDAICGERRVNPLGRECANLDRMSLEAQISLMTVPQEFTRLCNAVLTADHGDDFLPIDDDQADRGNDGYLKSEKRIFAAHCFKRAQNQSIEAAIKTKMIGDLGKAIALAKEADWEIEAWTFISNYPVSEAIGERLHKLGADAGIDVSWRGTDYLAAALQRHPEVRARFPSLQINEVAETLKRIEQAISDSPLREPEDVRATKLHVERSPRTDEEEAALLEAKPPGWEYLLFAGVLLQGRQALELKWHDHELGVGREATRALDGDEARGVLTKLFGPMRNAVSRFSLILDPAAQERAFGRPGEAGDELRIRHLGSRLIDGYEELLDLQAELRAYSPPEEYEEVFALAAELPNEPVRQIRTFIDELVEHADRIPAHFATEDEDREPLVIELTLTLSLAEGLEERFSRALKRLERRLAEEEQY
jgi:hypothetical protein